MDAKELRIGNWILPDHDLDGKYHLVKELGEKSINGYTEDWYSPIPLTPEILEKCGFVKGHHGNKDVFLITKRGWAHILQKCSDNLDMIRSFSSGYEFLDIQFMKPINYLHELQNLYFALTGEELPVNLTEPLLT